MMPENPIILLSIFTLVAVVGYLLWQRRSVRNSQARHGETPGETTMVRHDTAPLPSLPETRTAVGGDVDSFKDQDRSPAAGKAGDAAAVRASLDKAKPAPVA